MFDVFGSVKGLLKVNTVNIDNFVFFLHYKVTFIILVAFSLLVTSKQYIGDPIDCIVDEIPLPVMDTYCWIYSTFTIPNRLTGHVGVDVVQPGVASHVDGTTEIKYHKYYQWVCFTLFFQAMLFYIPRFMWKSWEGGLMKTLVLDLYYPVIDKDTKDSRIKIIVNNFIENHNRRNWYAYKFFFCEFLSLVNVVGQMFLMNAFLDGEFWSYGADVWEYTEMDPQDREDPMSRVFPKVTKCTFHKFGPSGSVQKFDGLCVLPVNIVNEKIYVFLWFWFMFMTAMSGLTLIYRLLVVLIPKFRYLATWLLLKVQRNTVSKLQSVNDKCQIGDWYVLNQMADNIDPLIFNEIVEKIDIGI